jgi:hypothetical protein
MTGFKPPARIGNFKPARGPARMDARVAEAIAARVLAAMADDPPVLMRFMTETGLAPADLAASAGEPGMLAAILEYVLGNEPLLLTIAAGCNLKPEELAAAHVALSRSAGHDDGSPSN